MDVLFVALAFAIIAACAYLWKTGRLEKIIAAIKGEEELALEFLKLPEKIKIEEKEVEGIEIIHFKGENGLELLVPPWLREVKRGDGKEIKIKPMVTLLTGNNLTGYFLLLTKMLFIMDAHPIFLVIKERDLEHFKRHSNIIVSIFKQKSELLEALKILKYQFHKGIISEEEFKKKLLEIKMQRTKSIMKEPLYDGYKYFSRPSEILQDINSFLLKTKNEGIVAITILDEMVEKNPEKARVFLEDMVKMSSQHSTPLILTSEQGVFSEKVNNTIRSYCDMVMETMIEKGNRYVTVYAFEKVFPKRRVSEALKNYEKFLKGIGFLE